MNTSFSDNDLLKLRLQARNFAPFGQDVTGTSMTRLGFDGDNGNSIELDQLYYRFSIGKRVVVQIDAVNVELDARGFLPIARLRLVDGVQSLATDDSARLIGIKTGVQDSK